MPRLAPAIAISMYYQDVLRVGLVLLAIAAVVVTVHVRRPRQIQARPVPDAVLRARQILALGVGGLWVLDGLLQMQPAMVTSFGSGLVSPLLSGQPAWLAGVVEAGVRLWRINPVGWNVFATFVQLVIGILILIGGEGRLRRIGLWASVGWGVSVWIGGEAMGGLFAGGSWLAGTPGSVCFYVLSAALLLAGVETWRRGRWLRWFGWGMAALWLLSTGLQAWPANGYWAPKGLYSFVLALGRMRQPHLFAAPLLAWATMVRAHPALWNGGLVLGLFGLTIAWIGWPSRPWVWAITIVWEFATWWFGQDFGVLGGMGTDPNTGPVLILLVIAYAAAVRAVAQHGPHAGPASHVGPATALTGTTPSRGRLR